MITTSFILMVVQLLLTPFWQSNVVPQGHSVVICRFMTLGKRTGAFFDLPITELIIFLNC